MAISPGASVSAVVQVGATVDASVTGGALLGVSVGTQTYRTPDPYLGEYSATPTQDTQTFATSGMTMTADFVVNPIPSNYGLIEWDGSVLTVS